MKTQFRTTWDRLEGDITVLKGNLRLSRQNLPQSWEEERDRLSFALHHIIEAQDIIDEIKKRHL